eukprot:1462781-Amphidinium_carterae.1
MSFANAAQSETNAAEAASATHCLTSTAHLTPFVMKQKKRGLLITFCPSSKPHHWYPRHPLNGKPLISGKMHKMHGNTKISLNTFPT